jgi:D-alanyl-D-alanine carboxypeptidase/D-alanyl-D-alanine-endopeptidase (penicillin-binding protein 4)
MESTQFIPAVRDEPRTPPRAQVPPVSAAETTQHMSALSGFDRYQREKDRRDHDGADYDGADYDGGEPTGTDGEPVREPDTATTTRRRKRRNRVLVVAGALVVVIAVGVGVVVSSPTVAQKLGLSAIAGPTTQAPPSPVAFSAQVKPPNADAPMPTPAGVSAALSGLAADPALGTLHGTVMDAATGKVLWDDTSSMAGPPASTNKLLTSAAALLTLSPEATLNTTVVAGSQPGTIVLVGGGDPTLNSLPAPQQSVYPGSARMDDLAAQVKAKVGGKVTRILVDTSLFSGPDHAAEWDPAAPSQNNWAPIQSVMLDGGRLNPKKSDTPRNYTPALSAGQLLAEKLGVPQSAVSGGTAPAGSQVLGEVHSATVPDLISNLLQISDNVLAEDMGRQVAIADHKPASFAGATDAVLDVLHRNGFDTSGAALLDNSGLSPTDHVPARLLAQVLQVAASNNSADPRVAKLRPLLDGLPIAGSEFGDGTLANRYQTAPSSAGRGWVRAKTGTLAGSGINALAGVVLDKDGRVLVFALLSSKSQQAFVAPSVLDKITASLRGCGCG